MMEKRWRWALDQQTLLSSFRMAEYIFHASSGPADATSFSISKYWLIGLLSREFRFSAGWTPDDEDESVNADAECLRPDPPSVDVRISSVVRDGRPCGPAEDTFDFTFANIASFDTIVRMSLWYGCGISTLHSSPLPCDISNWLNLSIDYRKISTFHLLEHFDMIWYVLISWCSIKLFFGQDSHPIWWLSSLESLQSTHWSSAFYIERLYLLFLPHVKSVGLEEIRITFPFFKVIWRKKGEKSAPKGLLEFVCCFTLRFKVLVKSQSDVGWWRWFKGWKIRKRNQKRIFLLRSSCDSSRVLCWVRCSSFFQNILFCFRSASRDEVDSENWRSG